MHVDISEVSQGYLCTMIKLRDGPRMLSFAIGLSCAMHLA